VCDGKGGKKEKLSWGKWRVQVDVIQILGERIKSNAFSLSRTGRRKGER